MYAATLLERHKILEFTPALLPNHSNLPQNRLAVYEERPGRFVYQAYKCGLALVQEDSGNPTHEG